jgi:hypothetical protein
MMIPPHAIALNRSAPRRVRARPIQLRKQRYGGRARKLAPRVPRPHRCPAKEFGKPNNLFGQPTFWWVARTWRL